MDSIELNTNGERTRLIDQVNSVLTEIQEQNHSQKVCSKTFCLL